jgi:hypothetical protein
MTEEHWQRCPDPGKLLQLLRGKVSIRKLYLFGAACCRRIWEWLEDERSCHAVEVAERWAEGMASEEERMQAAAAAQQVFFETDTWPLFSWQQAVCIDAAGAALFPWREDSAHQADIDWVISTASRVSSGLGVAATPDAPSGDAPRVAAIRAESAAQAELLRSIIRPLPFRAVEVPDSVLEWRDGLVRRLARVAYDERLLPSGHLDPDRVAVLADAAEEAGANAELLTHLRDERPKVRGAWVVDLLLG